MLDIKTIREKTDWVCARLAARNAGDESKVREILALDEVRRKNLAESERLKSIRNKVSKEIGMLMGKKLLEEANAKKKETAEIGGQIAQLDKELEEIFVRTYGPVGRKRTGSGQTGPSAPSETLQLTSNAFLSPAMPKS